MTIARPVSSIPSTISMGVQLRRRQHTLGHSKGVSTPPMTPMTATDTDDHQTPTEYDMGSDSSENDDGVSSIGSPTTKNRDSPKPTLQKPPSPVRAQSSNGTTPSHSTRAWYEFDLSVILALISPIGNWLTGGDHVKNLLLILLLVYYLHQIIEIPWGFYHAARPRRSANNVAISAEHKYDIALASELRFYELSFLTLTVLSPFFGAALLRQITTTVAGAEIISWFSTGLFVLATGIRPWRHFIERISQRVEELHDTIHYPPIPDGDASKVLDMELKMEQMAARLAVLETAMTKTRGSVRNSREEQFEYVDDAMEGVQKVIKRIEKRNEHQDERLQALESGAETLRKTKGKTSAKEVVYLSSRPKERTFFTYLIPRWFLPAATSHSPPSPSSPNLRHPLRTFSSSARLETIMEEEPRPTTRSRFRFIPWMDLVFHWGDLATLPLRAVLSLLFGRRS